MKIKPVLDSAKASFVSAAALYGPHWKGFAVAGAAAAAFAPAVFSNDDRGYGRTALITTPVIGAAWAAAPELWKGVKEAQDSLTASWKNKPFGFDKSNLFSGESLKVHSLTDLRDLFDSGYLNAAQHASLSSQMAPLISDMKLNYYSNLDTPLPRSTGDIFDSALARLNELRDPENPLFDPIQAEHAWTEATFRSSTRKDRMAEVIGGGRPDAFDADWIESQLRSAHLDMPEEQGRAFLETMERRLGSMKRTKLGPQQNPILHPLVVYTKPEVDHKIIQELKDSYGAVGENIERALEKKWITNAKAVRDESGIVGLEVYRQGERKPLVIPMVDEANSRALSGDALSNKSVARGVAEPGGVVYKMDDYLTMRLDPKYSFEELRKVRDRRLIHSGAHIDDEWWSEYAGMDSQVSMLNDAAMERRADQVVFSDLSVYDGGKTWEQLDQAERAALMKEASETWATKVGSESGLPKGVLEMRRAERYTLGQLPSQNAQDMSHRWMTKPLSLDYDSIAEGGFSTGGATADSVVDAYHGAVPQIKQVQANVTPEQKNLFAYLPAPEWDQEAKKWTVTDDIAAALRSDEIGDEAIRAIMSDLRSSKAENFLTMPEAELRSLSSRSWEVLREGLIAAPERLAAARKLGFLGEGDRIVSGKFASLSTIEKSKVRVDHLHMAEGQEFGPNDIIGFDDAGREIRSNASRNKVLSVRPSRDGVGIDVFFSKHEQYQTGFKSDLLGRKGLDTLLEYGEDKHIEDVMNLLHESTGRGRPYQGVEAWANAAYFNSKVREQYAFEAVFQQADDMVKRMKTMRGVDMTGPTGRIRPDGSLAEGYSRIHTAGAPQQLADDLIRDLGKEQVDFHAKDWAFGEDNPLSKKFGLYEHSEAVRALTEEQKAFRQERITERIQQFLSDADQMATGDDAGVLNWLQHDDVMRAYRSQREAGHVSSLQDYLFQYHQAANVSIWDHTRRDMPGQVRTTFDLYEDLDRAGEFETAKEILSTTEVSRGETRQAWEYLQHLEGGDFSSPFGGHVVDMADLPERINLNDDLSFVNTIFDPNHEKYRDNFSIKVNRDIRTLVGNEEVVVKAGQFLPVRGMQTYKTGANEFGAGEMSASKYQRSLADLMNSLHGEGPLADQVVAERFHRHIETAVNDLVGKGGVLRAEAVHPNSVSGAIVTRPSRQTIDPAVLLNTGEHSQAIRNPFEVVMSRDLLKSLDEKSRKALEEGRDVFAAGFRHPISEVPFLKVRLADKADGLGNAMIGIDEGLRSIIQADSDKDILNMLFLDPEGDAFQRAKNAYSGFNNDFSQMSNQWKRMRMVELMQGNLENSAKMSGQYLREHVLDAKSLLGNITKTVEEAKAGKRFAKIGGRMALGATGAYSNLLSQLHFNLGSHPTLANRGADREMLETLFWNARQVPISAGKNKMNLGDNAMMYYDQIMHGLHLEDRGKGSEMVHDALSAIAKESGFETVVSSERDLQDINKIWGIKQVNGNDLKVGDVFNLHKEVMGSDYGRNLVTEFVSNRNRSVDDVAKLVTKGQIAPEDAFRRLRRMSYGAETIRGAFAGEKAAATKSAHALGMANDALKSAMGSIRKGFKPAMPILGVGAGVAALAGFLSTPIEDEGVEVRGGAPPEAPGARRSLDVPTQTSQPARQMAPGAGMSRPSANEHRPEERIGVQDAIPGEGVSGSASSAPPVRVTAAPAQTPTAMVAPINRNRDVEVSAKAPNRSAAAETAKQVAEINSGGGNTNVTVNHIGGWRNQASKLRTKQQLRDEMNRTPQY